MLWGRAWAGALFVSLTCCMGGEELAELRALGEGCLLDSDCTGAMRCVFRVCHEECATSADCPAGALCVLGAPPHHVCLLPQESPCTRSSDCPSAMICAPDLRCRDACASSHDCVRDQVCTPQRACALPGELEGGLLPTVDPGWVAGCALDSDCVTPERCHEGACQLPCVVNEDCPSGSCVGGLCAPPGAVGPSCVPGYQAACDCATPGEVGVHVCDPDGSGYGPCVGCTGGGGAGGAGGGGAGGGGAGGGGAGGGGAGGALPGGACPPAVGDPDPSLAFVSPIDFANGWPTYDVAQGPSGGVVLGGNFSGDLTLDGQLHTAISGTDGFVARFDATGALDGVLTFDDGNVGAVVVTPSGEIWAAGSYAGAPSLGGPALPSGPGCFLLKLSAAGAHLFSAGYPVSGGFPSGCHQASMSLTLGPSGEVVLTSGFRGNVDFGTGTLTSPAANLSAKILAVFDASGTNLFAHAFGGPSGTVVGSTYAAMSPSGEVFVTSTLFGSAAFGGLVLTSTGDLDLVTAGFDASGMHLFSQVFSGGVGAAMRPAGAAVDAAGDLVVVGSYEGAPDFGGGALPASATASAYELRLDAFGAHVASASVADVFPKGFALDGAGRLLVAGEASQPLQLGPCDVLAAAPVVYRRSAGGAIDWVRAWPSLVFGDDQLAANAAGELVARFGGTGSVATTYDFGAGPVMGRNFVVSMSPTLP